MAQALDANPYTLYDTARRDASEMVKLLFLLNEFNPSAQQKKQWEKDV